MGRYVEKATPEKIAKLPAWARDHVANLERRIGEREREISRLRAELDGSGKSDYVVADYNLTGGRQVHAPSGIEFRLDHWTVRARVTEKEHHPKALNLNWHKHTGIPTDPRFRYADLVVWPQATNTIEIMPADLLSTWGRS